MSVHGKSEIYMQDFSSFIKLFQQASRKELKMWIVNIQQDSS